MLAYLRYASISRSLLPWNRSLLTLAHTSGMRSLMGLFCVYNRSLLPYGRPLLTLAHTSVIPEAIALMPSKGVFALLFFVMLLLLGFTSAVSLVEAGVCVCVCLSVFVL